MHDELFEHEHLSVEDRQEIAKFIWGQESVELTTVGIDIGSSTSHFLFAKLVLQRPSQSLSSRFVVTRREVLWRSPIMLTPFVDDDSIDAHRLGHFIRDGYKQAGLERKDVDSGAVILTGEAIKRKNAQAIDELFAGEAGKFVCATAGHKLESMLAAHGSGAVHYSKINAKRVLHVDIGGGTTKLALIESGVLTAVAAFAAGGRLLATDGHGSWSRIDLSARLVAAELGIAPTPGAMSEGANRRAIAGKLARVIMDYVLDVPRDPLGDALLLTEPLPPHGPIEAITFSGGVSEYLFGRETRQFGDIALMLADEIRTRLATDVSIPIVDPGQGVRATVVGASQFTVQVSGKTIYMQDPALLPVHNVPVIHADIETAEIIRPQDVARSIAAGLDKFDLSPDARLAVAFAWSGAPEHSRLAAACRGIKQALDASGARKELLLLMIDGDVGSSFGHLLKSETGLSGPLISIDGVQLQDLDFVDLGQFLNPPGVIPVVIKSLLFGHG